MAIEDTIKNLEASNDKAGLEKMRDEAEVGFDGATQKLAEEALSRLSKQAEDIGGTQEQLSKRTESVDAEINTVKADAEKQVAEVEGEKVETPNESKSVDIEKRRAEIQNEIKLIKMLLDYREELGKMEKEFWIAFSANKSEVDVLTTDSEEVQALKKAKYQELQKPFSQKKEELSKGFIENGFNKPEAEQDRLMGTSVWRGDFETFAQARTERLQAELAKL